MAWERPKNVLSALVITSGLWCGAVALDTPILMLVDATTARCVIFSARYWTLFFIKHICFSFSDSWDYKYFFINGCWECMREFGAFALSSLSGSLCIDRPVESTGLTLKK